MPVSVFYSPMGAGLALFIRSELTDDEWRIFSDNAEMVRWPQTTVQGMLNPETASGHIVAKEATFSRKGDLQGTWNQTVRSGTDETSLTWSRLIEPLLMTHDQPAKLPDRQYGASVVMIPAQEVGVTVNGRRAWGRAWPCRYDGRPFSTAALAFSESWRESAV